MEKYTIYCTEEQTKKALELGAPLFRLYGANCSDYINMLIINDTEAYTIPTVEQMIGYLEDQDCIDCITISKTGDYWYYDIKTTSNTDYLVNLYCKSRSEATLTAIDVALDYLENKK